MGVSNLSSNHPNINQINVVSTDEMYQEVNSIFPNSEISVFAAAVADYKPKKYNPQKIKKSEEICNLLLEKNIDILKEMSSKKKDSQLIIGFALETENEKENAIKKLQNKDLDLIVLNSTSDTDATFGFDTNKISIIEKDLTITDYDLKEKSEVAKDIVSVILKIINK